MDCGHHGSAVTSLIDSVNGDVILPVGDVGKLGQTGMGPELVVAGTGMGIGLRENVTVVASGGADAPGVGKNSALGVFKSVPIGYGKRKERIM